MLTIVVPMAGRGQRFAAAGYALPKPLISVRGMPMIQAVIDNLRPRAAHRFVFLCLRDHLDRHHLGELLATWAPGSLVVPVDTVTEGAACTVLLAEDAIPLDDQLMIANCDQWLDLDIDLYLRELNLRSADGLIMTMTACDPKWSYVRTDLSGWATEVAEKKVISNSATVGIYNYRRGGDFIRAAQRMIARGERVNGEFYVAPVYNQLIADERRIATFDVDAAGGAMYGLGTPEDLRAFEELPISGRVARPS
jgi:NDP-sugar pyrophosphorylase family protein